MALSISTDGVTGGVARLVLTGDIDLASADPVRDAIHQALVIDGAGELIVDLAGVDFLDSSGISALVKGHHVATTQHATYRVVNATGSTRRVLEITGVLEYLDANAVPADAG